MIKPAMVLCVVLLQDFSFRHGKECGCGNTFSRDPTAVLKTHMFMFYEINSGSFDLVLLNYH